MYVLDIQWLLLMEILNPREHSPKADGISIQRNLGTNFFGTIPSYGQDLGGLDEAGGWHGRSGVC